jgi:hypothetical protein
VTQIRLDLRGYAFSDLPAEYGWFVYFVAQQSDSGKVRRFQFLPFAVMPLIEGSGYLSSSRIMHWADGQGAGIVGVSL